MAMQCISDWTQGSSNSLDWKPLVIHRIDWAAEKDRMSHSNEEVEMTVRKTFGMQDPDF